MLYGKQKDNRKNCLEMTKNYISRASVSSRYILKILSGDVVEGERPDFLIENQSGTVGVEHFLIDTLIGKKKAARSRIRKSEIKRTFDKYHDSIEGNEENALKEIESIVQSDVDAVQNFEYKRFVSEFERIINEHSANVKEYKELHEDINKLAFLIELPISKNKMIGLRRDGTNEEIKGERFPITIDMLRILKGISNTVDYIIISVMHENYHNRPFVVYAFGNSNFEESIAPQLKEVYRSFTYDWQTMPFKAKVKLNLERIEKQ